MASLRSRLQGRLAEMNKVSRDQVSLFPSLDACEWEHHRSRTQGAHSAQGRRDAEEGEGSGGGRGLQGRVPPHWGSGDENLGWS